MNPELALTRPSTNSDGSRANIEFLNFIFAKCLTKQFNGISYYLKEDVDKVVKAVITGTLDIVNRVNEEKKELQDELNVQKEVNHNLGIELAVYKRELNNSNNSQMDDQTLNSEFEGQIDALQKNIRGLELKEATKMNLANSYLKKKPFKEKVQATKLKFKVVKAAIVKKGNKSVALKRKEKQEKKSSSDTIQKHGLVLGRRRDCLCGNSFGNKTRLNMHLIEHDADECMPSTSALAFPNMQKESRRKSKVKKGDADNDEKNYKDVRKNRKLDNLVGGRATGCTYKKRLNEAERKRKANIDTQLLRRSARLALKQKNKNGKKWNRIEA